MNVHHLYNKVPNVCALLLSQSSPDYHLFEITESRLKFRITDHSISIPDFYIIKRDPQLSGQTGIAVCAHQSIQTIIHRRKDLENYKIECTWLDLKPHAHGSSVFVICTETQRTTPLHRYYVDKVKNRADVLVFGDFNIDILEPHSCWVSTLFALVQLISHYSNPHE